jgi:hypothetical protein
MATFRPERRNRKIGTKAAGYKKSNTMGIPESWLDRDGSHRPYAQRIGPRRILEFELPGGPLIVLHEPPRAGCAYGCSPEDVAHLLGHVPAPDIEGLRLVAFRQPTRKQKVLCPVWGRLYYHADFGSHDGAAVVIEAVDLARPFRWPRKLDLESQSELARLRKDGHRIEEDRRGYTFHLTESSVRRTILYRTLLHEVGHWVDWLTRVERPPDGDIDRYLARPASEREAFAHGYADRLAESLRRKGVIPFPPREDTRSEAGPDER